MPDSVGIDITGSSADGYTGGDIVVGYPDSIGTSVASLGDINNDGFDNFIIGADLAGSAQFSRPGEAIVIFGEASGWSDINLTSLSSSTGFRIIGTSHNDRLGMSVSGAGDLNGDGFADIIVGAPHSYEAHVIFGKASGFGTIDVNNIAGRIRLHHQRQTAVR